MWLHKKGERGGDQRATQELRKNGKKKCLRNSNVEYA